VVSERDIGNCVGAEVKTRTTRGVGVGRAWVGPQRQLGSGGSLGGVGQRQRQVALWFQNRRARLKTKQLEKHYDALKLQLDAGMADNDSLISHNKKL
jgi:hypothetical protein